LRTICAAILIFFSTHHSFAQYYLRGEIRDEQGKPLSNVKIVLTSKNNYLYYSGSTGSFGIPSSKIVDTIVLSIEGYDGLKQSVETSKFQSFTLKTNTTSLNVVKHRLSSVTKNLTAEKNNISIISNESYSNSIENEFVEAGSYAETGFALNIDRASYSNIRRFINNESKVPREAVRIEEMLNYFNLNNCSDTASRKNFKFHSATIPTPWNNKTQLLYLNIKAPKLDLDSLKPSNLVFLIDISGSMDKPNRLPLLQSAFKLLVQNLRAKDTVSIVVYGGYVGVRLFATSGSEKQKIITVIDSLTAAGDTPGESAIRTAYRLAKNSYIPNGNNRVIIATDGDFNVGQTTEKELEDLIAMQRASGIYLTCLGVGMGNYKDSKLEVLAKKGNGNFAYLDNEKEAEKVLFKEFSETLYTVADNAFLNVKFNPEFVSEYRLIGFDNKQEAVNDNSSELEGGEIGTGHSTVALFEIVPTEKYLMTLQQQSNATLASLALQYNPVEEPLTLKTSNYTVPLFQKQVAATDSSVKLAAAVSMFGAYIKQSKFASNYTIDDILKLAQPAINKNDGAQVEFIQLLQKAKEIYNPGKKKKKKKDQ
jgi:Ca-activated chloride channel family protein